MLDGEALSYLVSTSFLEQKCRGERFYKEIYNGSSGSPIDGMRRWLEKFEDPSPEQIQCRNGEGWMDRVLFVASEGKSSILEYDIAC